MPCQNEKYIIDNNILYQKENGKKSVLIRVLYYINGTMQIDKDVKVIGDNAFYGQGGITEISIPDGVTTIGKSFCYCSELKKIEIPKTVTSIGDNCFSDATNKLEEIVIHNKENAISGAPWGAVKGMKVIRWNN